MRLSCHEIFHEPIAFSPRVKVLQPLIKVLLLLLADASPPPTEAGFSFAVLDPSRKWQPRSPLIPSIKLPLRHCTSPRTRTSRILRASHQSLQNFGIRFAPFAVYRQTALSSCNARETLYQVAHRDSLSVRMDEIYFSRFISANIGFFAASYLVFYPAELLKTRQQVRSCTSPLLPLAHVVYSTFCLHVHLQVSRHVHIGPGRDPYSVRGLIKDL